MPNVLLLGPHDPHCGEYTFLAPPLGVWRLAGTLRAKGIDAEVFDPNCCDSPPDQALQCKVAEKPWDVVGISTTGMTLQYDLALAHLSRRLAPNAVIVAGGMEATFKPESMFSLGPFDIVVLGEGEKPLYEIARRASEGKPLSGIPGTAHKNELGFIVRVHTAQLSREELRDAIFETPYESMPYEKYWHRLEEAYWVDEIAVKAEREARLAEIRSVRMITLNYCPMNCTFCSSTNFLHAAQGGTAPLARLDDEECIEMIKKIVCAHPRVRTVIFQDDIFIFTKDKRIFPLCERICNEKAKGAIPADLQFISTNRIDAMTPERMAAMRKAGFCVLGFGVESFSRPILEEFNKSSIFQHIDTNLGAALRLGITPFLDLILTSPRCSIDDVGHSIRRAFRWLQAGCEIGVYPYVIPFSGAAMSTDPSLRPHTVYGTRTIDSVGVNWRQAEKILPIDPTVRRMIITTELQVEHYLSEISGTVSHLPSRLRSLLWIGFASRKLTELGVLAPDSEDVFRLLIRGLPPQEREVASELLHSQEIRHAIRA